MTQPPQPIAGRPGGLVAKAEPARGGLVRAGRLAGGAVVTAWIVSVAYHVVLFVVMYALPWLAGIVAPSSNLPTPLTAVAEPAGPSITLEPSARVEADSVLPERDPLKFQPDRFEAMSAAMPTKLERLPVIGIGAGQSDFDKYGFRVSSASPGPEFFGLGKEARGARDIVYVVDRSGSMLNTFKGVVKELRKSIGELRRTQRFHVIFFNEGMPLENRPRRLVTAIQANKRQLFDFLDTITPMGRTDPRPAMQRAFAVEPDLIYFLTDGDFDPVLLQTLEALNRERKVRIFTIAYANTWGAELLERIAREHNGKYRFVSEDEIFQQ